MATTNHSNGRRPARPNGQTGNSRQGGNGGYRSRETGYSGNGGYRSRETGYSGNGRTQNRTGASRSTSRPVNSSTRVQRAVEAQKAAAKRKRKYVIFGVEVVLLAVMIGLLLIVFRIGGEGPSIAELPSEPEKLAIASEVQQQLEDTTKPSKMLGYWNIALFGVDAQNSKQLVKGGRSDSMMIASVNLDTGDIKLVSVYRDTYLNIEPDEATASFSKANHAYHFGGGEQAVKTLNANLDMNITDFVAIGYDGLEAIVNGLDGLYLDVDETEILHIDNYQRSIVEERTGKLPKEGDTTAYQPVTSTGYQKLNGLQVAAYCRIRYRAGGDFARAAVQREVIMAISERIKQASLSQLETIVDNVMPYVVTSIQPTEMLEYLPKAADFQIVAEDGFPQEDMRGGASTNAGDSVIPVSLESNVVWLHQFLFDDDDYTASSTVKTYSKEIEKIVEGRLK